MRIIPVIIACLLVTSCNNDATTVAEETDNFVGLRTDTINTVKISDTLAIYESTCRGCAYEGSTNFDIVDTASVVALAKIVTTDDNSAEMTGGNISKTLLLTPEKIGETTIVLYKTYGNDTLSAADSARAARYIIHVKN